MKKRITILTAMFISSFYINAEYLYIKKYFNTNDFINKETAEIYPPWSGESHATSNTNFVGPHTYIGDTFFDGVNMLTTRYDCGVGCGGSIQVLNGISNEIVAQYQINSNPNIYGIAVVNGDIITGDATEKILRIHDGYSSIVKETINISMAPYGITYNGSDLIIADQNGSVYIMDGVSSTIKETLPISGMHGVTFDGTNLWASNKVGIYKFNGYTNQVLETITPGNTSNGVGKKIIWDGTKIIEASIGSINGGPWRIYVH